MPLRFLDAECLLPGTRAPSPPLAAAAQPSIAARWLRQSESLERDGKAGPAQALYVKIHGDFPNDPAAPQALYRLGILQAEPMNPLKNYRAARATFTRLLAEYPRSSRDTEARVWQATLTSYCFARTKPVVWGNVCGRLKTIYCG
jgi:hypothetical protein